MPNPHYVHNPATKIVHDHERLDERCNTDDIAQKIAKPAIMDGYDCCRWCFPGRELLGGDADTPLPDMAFAVTDSTNIRAVSYTPQNIVLDVTYGELRVTFTSDSKYRYATVPEDVFHRLRHAKSVGSAFDRLVKRGGYSFERLDNQEPVNETSFPLYAVETGTAEHPSRVITVITGSEPDDDSHDAVDMAARMLSNAARRGEVGAGDLGEGESHVDTGSNDSAPAGAAGGAAQGVQAAPQLAEEQTAVDQDDAGDGAAGDASAAPRPAEPRDRASRPRGGRAR